MVLLLAVYEAGDLLPTSDSIGNMHVALSLLDEGNVSFTPLEKPFMFRWRLDAADGPQTVVVKQWSDTIGGLPAATLFEHGLLRPDGAQYYIVASRRTDSQSGQRLYVNTSGPGPGIAAAPIFALAQFWHGALRGNPAALWPTGKFAASLFVAASAALLYLMARRFIERPPAVVITLAYGLGTCVWSISSQALWQHGPNEFFLAAGLLALVAGSRGHAAPVVPHGQAAPAFVLASRDLAAEKWAAALCGLSLACAATCRPTSGMLLAAVGGYSAISDRRVLAWYAVAAAPVLAALAIYNTYYLGAPWRFGQTVAGHDLARLKIGTPGAWQTPLFEGLLGNLISPSRGLLVFSPFLAFAGTGIWLSWRKPELRALRPVSIGGLAMLLIESKHYDWWGGWTYGYRHIVDIALLLCALLIPAAKVVGRRRWLAAAFGTTVAWSITVQFVGALAYDENWNAPRAGYELRLPNKQTVQVSTRHEAAALVSQGAQVVAAVGKDIDSPKYRYRLWSIRDNEIWYYVTHFRESRKARLRNVRRALEIPG
jgi:hypothetical protein